MKLLKIAIGKTSLKNFFIGYMSENEKKCKSLYTRTFKVILHKL